MWWFIQWAISEHKVTRLMTPQIKSWMESIVNCQNEDPTFGVIPFFTHNPPPQGVLLEIPHPSEFYFKVFPSDIQIRWNFRASNPSEYHFCS